MEISEYRNIFENEKTHFFYVSTHNLAVSLINKWVERKGLAILDAGCGTGGLSVKLAALGSVSAIDASPEAIKFARRRGIAAKLASVEKIPYPSRQFDVVTCIDVIYHKQVKDDVGALSEIRRVLKPGGVLVLRVPANKFLMSAHDHHVHTARRYSRNELEKKMKRAGFAVKQISHVHSPIFLVSLVRVIWERLTHQVVVSSVGKIDPPLNSILTVVLKLEAEMITGGTAMPFGQGLIAVATPSRQSSLEQKRQ